jgi:hypothetical protein
MVEFVVLVSSGACKDVIPGDLLGKTAQDGRSQGQEVEESAAAKSQDAYLIILYKRRIVSL